MIVEIELLLIIVILSYPFVKREWKEWKVEWQNEKDREENHRKWIEQERERGNRE